MLERLFARLVDDPKALGRVATPEQAARLRRWVDAFEVAHRDANKPAQRDVTPMWKGGK